MILVVYENTFCGAMNGGDWQCDTYAGKYSIGTSTGGMKLNIRHNAVGDILAVAPSGGAGGFYVSSAADNHPYVYLQDSAGTTTNLIFIFSFINIHFFSLLRMCFISLTL